MQEQEKFNPTPAELEILQFLWKGGAATVKAVHEHLNATKEKEVGYTTTLKTMQVMFERGLLNREALGRKHLYTAAIKEGETQDRLLDRFLHRTFGGSAVNLVMKALGNYKSNPKELEELKQYINSIEKDQQ